jgi:glucose/arabinose dehydrogenase
VRIALRIALAVAVALVGLVGACRLLLPERFAVNAPLGQMLFGRTSDAPGEAVVRERLQVPQGFGVALYAEGLGNARLLRFTPAGDLLLSQPRQGSVTLLDRDADGDGRPDGRRALLEGLDRPHGMDLRDGWLYVAETSAVGRIRFDPETRQTSGDFERVVTGIPGGGNHWTRTLRFGPDGWMYVSVGSSCNVCIEEHPWRATLLRFRPDGSQGEVYASGLRNSVGFDWRPETGELYATDNGRDLLGDDVPPCELNHIVQGGFYGWPYAYGDRVPDPDFGAGHAREIAASIPPAHAFGAHNAPLGMTFVRGEDVPPPLRGAALVALHGSWNRTKKAGYKVVSLHWEGGERIVERDFLSGFEVDEQVIGRPVDVAQGPDGAFYVSDDYAGAIWRVAWGAPTAGVARAVPKPAAAPPDRLAALSSEERERRAATGRALYEDHGCFRCHETTRAGPGVVARPLEDLASRYDLAALTAFLAAPTPPMPVFELDREQRRDLAVFLLSP